MTKKLTAIILTMLIALSMFTIAFAAGTPTITVSSATAEPGETVTLNVSLSNNPGINTFSLAFDYDTSKLNLTGVELADGINGQFAYGKKAVWLNSKDVTTNGNYLVATFEVLENATAGDARVAVTYGAGEISNYDEEDVDFELVSGKVTIMSDVSADGTIEVGTATAAPGTTVTVPVSITKNPGINTFSLGFDYDTTKLELVDVAINETLGGQFAYSKKAVWLSGKDTTYTGEILTLTFKVKESVADGDVPVAVTCTVGEISNYDEEDLIFDLVAGKVVVKAAIDEDAPQIYIDNVTARAGERISVPIRLKNNPGITGMRVFVDYDDSVLTLVDKEDGGLLSSMSSSFSPSFATKPYQMQWSSGTKDVAEDGVVITLIFDVAEDAELNDYTISISYDEDEIFNTKFENVDFAVKEGVVSVIDYIPGDVNGDNIINLKDVALLQQYLSGWEVSIVEVSADTNGDGSINLKDVALLQQYLSGWEVTLK